MALILAVAASMASLAYADLFDPPRPLFEVSTEFFDIVYPGELRQDASYLSSIADGVYRDIAADLGFTRKMRMPVVLTPDSEIMNGYTILYPYTRIVLYVVPAEQEGEVGGLNRELRKVFMHELTHAISLNTQGPFWQALSSAFGDIYSPNATWRMQEDMVEGGSVAFESLDGYGRVEDPMVRELVRQDILEGGFKGFDQCSGAWDTYPEGSVYYDYGGLFSDYLIRTYGMERYAALWKKAGEGNPLASFRSVFKKTYGLPLDDVWKDFGRSLALSVPVVQPETPLPVPKGIFAARAASGDTLYYVDTARSAAFSYSTRTGRERFLFEADGLVDSLAVSPDGENLLVSWAIFTNGFPRLTVREFSLASGKFLPGGVRKLREAIYFRDGYVGIEPDGSAGNLVFVRGSDRRVLVKGREGFALGSPAVFDDDSIVFLLNDGGSRKIARYSFSDGTVSILETPIPTVGLRGISVTDGVIHFAMNGDETLYRLARISDGRLYLQSSPASGGVFLPVALKGAGVYYVARFSSGERLESFPEGRPGFTMEDSGAVRWVALGDGAENQVAAGAVSAAPFREMPYSPFPYALRFTLFPNAGTAGSSSSTYLGFLALGQDPVERRAYSLGAAWDWADRFAPVSATLSTVSVPVSLAFSASDSLGSGGRTTSAGISASYTLPVQPDIYGVVFGTSLGSDWIASTASGSPYSWNYAPPMVQTGASVSLDRLTASPFNPSNVEGYSLSLAGDWGYRIATAERFADSIVSARVSLPVVPLTLSCSAAAASSAILSASGNDVFRTVYQTPPELADSIGGSVSFDRMATGEAYLVSPSLEIQRSGLGLHANRIYATGGGRFFAAPDTFVKSAFLRGNLTLSPLLGFLSVAHLTSFIELNYAVDTRRFGVNASGFVQIPLDR